VTTPYTTSLTLLSDLSASISIHIPLSATNQASYHELFSGWKLTVQIYDGWPWTACNRGQQSLYLIYQQCSATTHLQNYLDVPVTWQNVLLVLFHVRRTLTVFCETPSYMSEK
jgi:hypothetical protein